MSVKVPIILFATRPLRHCFATFQYQSINCGFYLELYSRTIELLWYFVVFIITTFLFALFPINIILIEHKEWLNNCRPIRCYLMRSFKEQYLFQMQSHTTETRSSNFFVVRADSFLSLSLLSTTFLIFCSLWYLSLIFALIKMKQSLKRVKNIVFISILVFSYFLVS